MTLTRALSSLSNLSGVSFSAEELIAILDEFNPEDTASAEAAQQARDMAMGLTWIGMPGDSADTHDTTHLTRTLPQVAQAPAEQGDQSSETPVTPEHVLVTTDSTGLRVLFSMR